MTDVQNVLLVDDDRDLRTIGEMALSSVGGLTVRCAASGVDALRMAREELPDVILLDVMMPGLDGPSTLEELRADPVTRDVPVIFMTAKIQSHEIARYRQLGATGIIPKPFDPMTLADEVRRIVAAET